MPYKIIISRAAARSEQPKVVERGEETPRADGEWDSAFGSPRSTLGWHHLCQNLLSLFSIILRGMAEHSVGLAPPIVQLIFGLEAVYLSPRLTVCFGHFSDPGLLDEMRVCAASFVTTQP
ncbi:unnamed protein product [Haemonchus placei]|uniref:Uncharacterized protein n=1 Tax=Haemonchus placei TaxID=6290 RepID=A0A0N4W581_HAEPC|nr:unnamed protein product [Haemonchus placei]